MIGDGILFYLAENSFVFVGRNPTANWIEFHAKTGGYDVKTEYDDRSPSRPMGKPVFRKFYRYQIQGPNAEQVIKKLNGGAMPDIKFFNMGYITIAGRKVRALRHGMAGAPGLEVWGPYAEGDEIRAAILEAGKDAGIVQVGARAYATNTLESGWIPSPVPAVYTGDKMKAYREWLPGTSYEANAGARRQLRLQQHRGLLHDAVRTRLRRLHQVRPRLHRRRRAEEDGRQEPPQEGDLRLERQGCRPHPASVFAPPGENYKCIDLPLSNYASSSFDAVMSGGKMVGASMFSGYSFNERKMLSLGFVEEQYAKPGTQLTLVWGEENGGTKKTTVERHKQTELKVVVGPTPYAAPARETYHQGWRTAAVG